MNDYWHKQTAEKPLFPDLLWSRPENKHTAGKLLIIGGNLHGFAAPATAYNESIKAGIGTAKVLLPDALKKTVGRILENGEYAPSTPSGSFNKQSLSEMLDFNLWADGVLLAGDLGRNSETAVVLEQFLTKSTKQITVTKDAVDYFTNNPKVLLNRQNTTIVCTIAQLQKLCIEVKFTEPITFSMDLLHLVDALHLLSTQHTCNFVVKHLDTILVSSQGQVSTTKVEADEEFWRVATASHTAVWWLQNPTRPFEALTMGIIA